MVIRGKRGIAHEGGFKSQSAMEYLMTYGWAILIIAVVLGALFSLGVFNPYTFAAKAPPGACQVFRPNGPGTTSFINTEGVCNGELPEYTVIFSSGSNLENLTIMLPTIAISTGSSITITAWVKPVSSSNFGGVAITGPNQQVGWDTEYAPNGNNWLSSNTIATGGTWSFIVAQETVGESAAIYLNGALTGYTSNSLMTGTVPSGDWFLGSFFDCCQYRGGLANVQIYNTSLSQQEIQSLYQEGIGGTPINLQNLVGWWPLNGNANDYSGNNNNGAGTNVIYTTDWTSGYSPT